MATVAIGIVGFVSVVIFLLYAGKQASAKIAEKNKPRPFACENGLVEITAPGNWRVQDFDNEVASLQIGSLIPAQYLLVISEEMREFPPEFGLPEYAEAIVTQMRELVREADVSGLKSLEINWLPEFQQELKGEVDGLRIAYLVTCLEGGDHFHQVLTWTSQDLKVRHFPVFRSVVETFREIAASEE